MALPTRSQVRVTNGVAILLATGWLLACSQPVEQPAEPAPTWSLAYSHDDQGAATAGSKDTLIEAVRNGKPVRVYVKGQRVEHAADVQFLTIFEGEVFGQVTQIHSQRPGTDPPRMMFREPGVFWRSIYGSNGTVTALMDGNEERERRVALSWFIQQ